MNHRSAPPDNATNSLPRDSSTPGIRSEQDIERAEQEYFEKVWYTRTVVLERIRERTGSEAPAPDVPDEILDKMREIEARHAGAAFLPSDPWELGFLDGKLSALRWVLGDEWDALDT